MSEKLQKLFELITRVDRLVFALKSFPVNGQRLAEARHDIQISN